MATSVLNANASSLIVNHSINGRIHRSVIPLARISSSLEYNDRGDKIFHLRDNGNTVIAVSNDPRAEGYGNTIFGFLNDPDASQVAAEAIIGSFSTTGGSVLPQTSILHLDTTGASAQTGLIATNGISWGSALFTQGAGITFTVNSPNIVLSGGTSGRTFKLDGKACITGSTGASYIFWNFFNVTTGARFGSDGYNADPDNGSGGSGWDEIPSPLAVGLVRVTPNTSVTIQMRIGSFGGGAGTGTVRQSTGQTSVSIVEIKD